jgi:cell division septation protein DedD
MQAQGVPPMTAEVPEPPPGAPGRARASAAPRAAFPPPPNAGANAPLSLSPETADAQSGRSGLRIPPSLANTPTAPQAQGQLPPPPTRVASAPAGNGGNYLVQVSSQRSEADAQAAYRGLRARYPSVLGDRQAVIRRADLGSKGVFYRAMIGPFGSREEAIQLCGNLKAAGGDCVVQGN